MTLYLDYGEEFCITRYTEKTTSRSDEFIKFVRGQDEEGVVEETPIRPLTDPDKPLRRFILFL